MPSLLVLPDLREVLADNDEAGLKEIVSELHAATIADFSEGLSEEDTWQLPDHAPAARQAEIMASLFVSRSFAVCRGHDIGLRRTNDICRRAPR